MVKIRTVAIRNNLIQDDPKTCSDEKFHSSLVDCCDDSRNKSGLYGLYRIIIEIESNLLQKDDEATSEDTSTN